MIKDKTFGAVSMETKQFSGEMVLFLLLHIAFLVADRIIYIRQNRSNLKYQYLFYDKVNKKIIKNLNEIDNIKDFPQFKKEEIIIPPSYEEKLKDKYSIIYIQKETFNYPLFSKYLMHVIIVIFAHVFIFFFMPMYGNYKLNRTVYCKEGSKECNDFLKNTSLPIFYIFYIIYFVSSGLQVKYGFYDMKRKSILKGKSNSLYGGIYAGYKNIPFLYELKLGIDWTFTSTCLDLFQWNKFESVYDIIYTTNCAMTGINAKKVGQPVKKGSKITMGGVLSFALLLVLVGPLLLFSSLNPTNELNNLTNADLKVELGFIYKNELMKNYTIFQNSKPQSIGPITKKDFNDYNYHLCVDTKNFPLEQIQTVYFFEENDRNWDLSLPHINNLIDLIRSRNQNISEDDENYITRIDLIMDYTFYRPLPPEGQMAHKRYNNTIYTRGKSTGEEEQNLAYLGDALKYCNDVNITYRNKIYPPIRLRASSHPKSMKSEFFNNLDIQIGFVGCKNKTTEEEGVNITTPSYLESYFTFSSHFSDNHTEGIKFHVFSDKVSSTTFSYSVLTFYVAFVLVVGSYVRNFFAGQPEKIILTEMPHNEEIMDLCEGIKISRYSYDFEEEEKLYYILIEIMRSPDILILLTSSSIDQFNQRLDMTKKEAKVEEEKKEKK
jgi:ABC-type multidrug transport system fused ATPase/permease subunit